jgi:hypothetical protein
MLEDTDRVGRWYRRRGRNDGGRVNSVGEIAEERQRHRQRRKVIGPVTTESAIVTERSWAAESATISVSASTDMRSRHRGMNGIHEVNQRSAAERRGP